MLRPYMDNQIPHSPLRQGAIRATQMGTRLRRAGEVRYVDPSFVESVSAEVCFAAHTERIGLLDLVAGKEFRQLTTNLVLDDCLSVVLLIDCVAEPKGNFEVAVARVASLNVYQSSSH